MQTQNNVVEQVQFRLSSGASAEAFLTANEAVNQWVQQQPGFLYRTLTCNEQNEWTDLVFWQDQQTADQAAQAFVKAQETQPLMAAIDKDSVVMKHFEVLSQIAAAS